MSETILVLNHNVFYVCNETHVNSSCLPLNFQHEHTIQESLTLLDVFAVIGFYTVFWKLYGFLRASSSPEVTPSEPQSSDAHVSSLHADSETSLRADPETVELVVGFAGLKGAGKDTCAKVLREAGLGFQKASFAGTLKDIVSIAFGWDRDMLEGTTDQARSIRRTKDKYWSDALNDPDFTPVRALQLWGTDVVRKNFHPDFWRLSLMKKIEAGCFGSRVAITDVRFVNEVNAIHDKGGIIIRLERDPEPEWYRQVKTYHTHLQQLEECFPESDTYKFSKAVVENLQDLPEWFVIITQAERRGETVDMEAMRKQFPDMPHESEWRVIGCEDVVIENNCTEKELLADLECVLKSHYKL